MLISAILSLKVFRLSWPIAYRYFSLYLITAIVTELSARLWVFAYHQQWFSISSPSNFWIYTLSFIPQYLLLMMMYYTITQTAKIKKALFILIFIFIAFIIVNATVFQRGVINTYSHTLANLLVVLMAMVYFEEIRKQKEIPVLRKQPMLWISLGLWIFHLLDIPYITNINTLLNLNSNTIPIVLSFLHDILIITMHTFFIIALLCPTPPPQK